MAGRSAPTTGTTRCCSSSRQGYRVIAHDRRGHGRSTQTGAGNEMDTYAADVAELAADARPARTPSMSGTRPAAARSRAMSRRHGKGRVAEGRADRRGAARHGQDDKNPGGLPIEVFDGFRAALGRQPRAVLPRCCQRAVLRLQPPRREGLAGRDPELVAAGHDGRRQARTTTASRPSPRPTSRRT